MQHRHQIPTWLAIALLGMLNLLSACGQKGPLYLPPPEDRPQAEQPSPDISPDR